MTDCIYEITVFGNTAIGLENPPDFYPVKFRLFFRFGRYEVWLFAGMIVLRCGFFDREVDAKSYINRAMKTAMAGKLIYRDCVFCRAKNYYHGRETCICIDCGVVMYKTDPWLLDETQNEKKSKHMGYIAK